MTPNGTTISENLCMALVTPKLGNLPLNHVVMPLYIV